MNVIVTYDLACHKMLCQLPLALPLKSHHRINWVSVASAPRHTSYKISWKCYVWVIAKALGHFGGIGGSEESLYEAIEKEGIEATVLSPSLRCRIQGGIKGSSTLPCIFPSYQQIYPA